MHNYEFDISNGHIWFGSLPNQWCYDPSEFKESILEKLPTLPSEVRSICLRLFLPKFNLSSGILGACFSPGDSQELRVRVGVLNEISQEHPVTTGLPTGLAETVINEAVMILQKPEFLSAGVLRFDCAAWHQTDSNPFIFKLLTRCVISLLALESELASEEEIMHIVKRELQALLSEP
jgi:hypothetical protein